MMTRLNLIAISAVAICSTVVPALLANRTKVLVDGTNWGLATVHAMDGTLEVLTDGNTHPPIYEVNVLRPGTDYSNLHLEKAIASKDLNLAKPMELAFQARAESPRVIRVALQDAKSEPWAAEVKLTSDWKEFRLPFKPARAPIGQAILAFQLGGTSGEVAISEIKLERS